MGICHGHPTLSNYRPLGFRSFWTIRLLYLHWHTLTHLFSVFIVWALDYTHLSHRQSIHDYCGDYSIATVATTGDEKQNYSRRSWLRLPQSLRNRRAWINSWTCFPRRFKSVVFWIQKLVKKIFLPKKCQRALPWADCSWWAAESRSRCWLRFGCWNLESGWNCKNLEGIRRFSVGKHVSWNPFWLHHVEFERMNWFGFRWQVLDRSIWHWSKTGSCCFCGFRVHGDWELFRDMFNVAWILRWYIWINHDEYGCFMFLKLGLPPFCSPFSPLVYAAVHGRRGSGKSGEEAGPWHWTVITSRHPVRVFSLIEKCWR